MTSFPVYRIIMSANLSPSKEMLTENAVLPKIETASSGSQDHRVGIERAFNVVRNHTVHTKGYVLTALKLIEEFGTASDKSRLAELLREKGQTSGIAPAPKKRVVKRK